jgi:hypothetical protein
MSLRQETLSEKKKNTRNLWRFYGVKASSAKQLSTLAMRSRLKRTKKHIAQFKA